MIEIILLGISMVILRYSLLDFKPEKGKYVEALKKINYLYFVPGFVLSALGGYYFAVSLEGAPLLKAFPRLSLVYAVIIPLETVFLKEKLKKNELIGLFLIIGGSLLL